MEFVVLGLLILQNLTLYELNREFKQGISLFYSASYGSLQIAVKNLLAKNLVIFQERVEHGRNKKIYSITELGKGAFYRWMLEDIPPNKLEVIAISKVYFLGLIENREQKKQILREIITKIQSAQEMLVQLDRSISRYQIPVEYQEIARYRIKTLDYGIQTHGFALEWFVALLNEIEGPQPPGSRE